LPGKLREKVPREFRQRGHDAPGLSGPIRAGGATRRRVNGSWRRPDLHVRRDQIYTCASRSTRRLSFDAGARQGIGKALIGFEKALARLGNGQTDVTWRRPVVGLAGDTFNHQLANAGRNEYDYRRNGQAIAEYQYMSVGAIFRLAGKAGGGGG